MMKSRSFQRILTFLLFVIVIIVFFAILIPKHGEFPQEILLKKDGRVVSFSERSDRIKLLSEIVLAHQTTHTDAAVSSDSERLQLRLSFVGLMAILLGALFNSDRKSDSKGEVLGNRLLIVGVAILLFLGFFLLDIHTVDIVNRSEASRKMLDNTIIFLSGVSSSDSTWYNLDYTKANEFSENMKNKSKLRKVLNLFRPDLSQIVFYYLPLFILLIVFRHYEKPIISTR